MDKSKTFIRTAATPRCGFVATIVIKDDWIAICGDSLSQRCVRKA
jgi:hypothetical protein